ncbi:golgi to ER traffic protein 1 [[Candida] railenensis]|uniref:Golgi to ER traffic protein 1 n=1 Tax=[Candida] railenensis TaxID=45579 RepID=A0A9P0QUJ3_9ASCO|nr:golgi to ER traffic protein 1 [[Candida] railenensis]
MLDLQPFTILFTILLVILSKQIVGAIGKKNIEKLVWNKYCSWKTSGTTKNPASSDDSPIIKLAKLKSDLTSIKAERSKVSAQDQYAKWTKLNRQHDKLEAEIKVMNEAIVQDEQRISKYVGYIITIATTIPIWVSRVWFRKTILFYVPPGALPYPVEWVLALPFVPTGGIGLTIWMFSLNSVISSLISTIQFIFFDKKVSKPVEEKENGKVGKESKKIQ